MKFLKIFLFLLSLVPCSAVMAQEPVLTKKDGKLSFCAGLDKVFAGKQTFFEEIKGDSIPGKNLYDRRYRATFSIDGAASVTVSQILISYTFIEYGPFVTKEEAEQKMAAVSKAFLKCKSSYSLLSFREEESGLLAYSGRENVKGGTRDEDVSLYCYKYEEQYLVRLGVKGGDYSKVYRPLKGKRKQDDALVKSLVNVLEDIKNDFANVRKEEKKYCFYGASNCTIIDVFGEEFVGEYYGGSSIEEASKVYNRYVEMLKNSLGDEFEYDDELQKNEPGAQVIFFRKNYKTVKKSGGINVCMDGYDGHIVVSIKVHDNFWRF